MKEALKLALEALEDRASLMKWQMARDAIKEALAQPEITFDGLTPTEFALRELYEFQEATGCDTAAEFKTHPEQEPVAWKLVPTEPTDEMLKAMDECSTEGYDERLYAGHAASVYMAAVDVAPTPPKPEQEPVAWMHPSGGILRRLSTGLERENYTIPLYTTPPQRTWVGLTDEEINKVLGGDIHDEPNGLLEFVRAIEAKLKEKNT